MTSIPRGSARMGVYVITHQPTARQYVGASLDVPARWRDHRVCLDHGTHGNGALQEAWTATAPCEWIWRILEIVPSRGLLRLREQYWLNALAPIFNSRQGRTWIDHAYAFDAEQFWTRVARSDGCWEWTRCQRANGTGKVSYYGRSETAHRVAWMLTHGPIPQGVRLTHLCGNAACCRPDHLRLQTPLPQSPPRMCACGCGRQTGVIPETCRRRGLVKGQRYRYLAGHYRHRSTPASPEVAATRFWSRVTRQSGEACWEWSGYRSRGYGQTSLNGTFWSTHRLAWFLTNGEIPPDRDVLHRCGNRACVRPDHLYLGTDKDNTADRRAMGRSFCGDSNPMRMHPECVVRGERHYAHLHPESRQGKRNGRAVLNEDQVREIRARYAAGGLSYKDLAQEYGVSKSLIGQIIQRTCWTLL